MKLSIYILQRWFIDQKPILTVGSGKREISGARLFSDDVHDGNYLYVGKMTDFFPDGNSDQIMMVWQQDVMCLPEAELDDVFNRVLAAFDFYNKLEASMMECIFQEEPEQHIISIWEEFIGPTFIMTPDYRILACSQNYFHEHINPSWDFFSVHKHPSLDNIISMRSSNIVGLMSGKQYITEFVEHTAFPYEYGIISSYCNPSGGLIGHLVIADKQPITPFEKDVMSIIMEALVQLQQHNLKKDLSHIPEINDELLFFTLLSNTECTQEKNILLAVKNWKQSDYFRILMLDNILLDNTGAQQIAKEELKQYIRDDGIVVIHESQVCCLTRQDSDEDSWMEKIRSIAVKMNVRVGISNLFQSLDHCFWYEQQCREALIRNRKSQVADFSEVAVPSILASTQPQYKAMARHPLVILLEDYDHAHSAELSYTLYLYLAHERSIKKTANVLFLHRNTVQYRLEKIKSFYPVDFESSQERLYLILSLLQSFSDAKTET